MGYQRRVHGDCHQNILIMNCCFLVVCLSVLVAVVASQMPGAPGKVDSIPQEIIEFATRKLEMSNNGLLQSCAITPVMGTFSKQLVNGEVFRFDLKVQNLLGSDVTCATAPETCHMAVLKPGSWAYNQDLQVMIGGQDNTHCTREPVKSNQYNNN